MRVSEITQSKTCCYKNLSTTGYMLSQKKKILSPIKNDMGLNYALTLQYHFQFNEN